MNRGQYLAQRRPAWQEFEKLLAAASQRGWKPVDAEQAERFSQLYREVCHDLSLVQSRGWGQRLTRYLNGLVSRGHNSFYSTDPFPWGAIGRFLGMGFPRLFRRNISYFVAACLLFFGPFAVTWAVVQRDPDLALRVVPLEQLQMAQAMYPKVDPAEAGSSFKGASERLDSRNEMAGFYTKHNAGIAFDCFGRGVAFGLGTIYTLLFNGIFLGTTFGYLVGTGHGTRLLLFAISHGSFELVAIAVAGAAGLMLGDSLLRPGQRTRLESLRDRGLEAVQLALGAGVMLFVAALIEAYWSPSDIPDALKVSGGVCLWLLVIVYLSTAGRWEAVDEPA